ncbi:STAS domain-containing protein [Streptomyces sp. NPDC057939]|uniref:STAS domain-containing protein n=1 Tax=Streptomyces sp. NPDC057939 TaxID=3346284 RepID=UPI0036EA9386
MTPIPGPLRLIRTDMVDAVRIELHGDFDHRDADDLLDTVTAVLAEPGRPREVRVDFMGVTTVDSSGLSVLLMARRIADAAGVRLSLDNRSRELERMLRVTGTLDHFTRHNEDSRSVSSTEQEPDGGPPDPVTVAAARPKATT